MMTAVGQRMDVTVPVGATGLEASID